MKTYDCKPFPLDTIRDCILAGKEIVAFSQSGDRGFIRLWNERNPEDCTFPELNESLFLLLDGQRQSDAVRIPRNYSPFTYFDFSPLSLDFVGIYHEDSIDYIWATKDSKSLANYYKEQEEKKMENKKNEKDLPQAKLEFECPTPKEILLKIAHDNMAGQPDNEKEDGKILVQLQNLNQEVRLVRSEKFPGKYGFKKDPKGPELDITLDDDYDEQLEKINNTPDDKYGDILEYTIKMENGNYAITTVKQVEQKQEEETRPEVKESSEIINFFQTYDASDGRYSETVETLSDIINMLAGYNINHTDSCDILNKFFSEYKNNEKGDTFLLKIFDLYCDTTTAFSKFKNPRNEDCDDVSRYVYDLQYLDNGSPEYIWLLANIVDSLLSLNLSPGDKANIIKTEIESFSPDFYSTEREDEYERKLSKCSDIIEYFKTYDGTGGRREEMNLMLLNLIKILAEFNLNLDDSVAMLTETFEDFNKGKFIACKNFTEGYEKEGNSESYVNDLYSAENEAIQSEDPEERQAFTKMLAGLFNSLWLETISTEEKCNRIKSAIESIYPDFYSKQKENTDQDCDEVEEEEDVVDNSTNAYENENDVIEPLIPYIGDKVYIVNASPDMKLSISEEIWTHSREQVNALKTQLVFDNIYQASELKSRLENGIADILY